MNEDDLVLGSAPGLVLHLLPLGAAVRRMEITGGDGERRNVTLGHPAAQDYLEGRDYLGAVVGRYANRIARGRFELGAQEIRLDANDRGNHLHGGFDGFSRRSWKVERADTRHARLSLQSPDGDQGFPGSAQVCAEYTVDETSVRLALTATADAPTVLNLTSHLYLNLNGEGAGTIDDHHLQVEADQYTPVDEAGIPLGPHSAVLGTPFDLRRPALLGPRIRHSHEQVRRTQGIDHNFVLRGAGLRRVATLSSSKTRTLVDLWCNRPGLQVYTGNFLDGSSRSMSGGAHRQGDGIALEPQFFPDSPNHPEWPSALVEPGRESRCVIEWRFAPTQV